MGSQAERVAAEVLERQIEAIFRSWGMAPRDRRLAARLMVERKIGCLPIVEEGRVVGIVTATDILAVVAAGGSA